MRDELTPGADIPSAIAPSCSGFSPLWQTMFLGGFSVGSSRTPRSAPNPMRTSSKLERIASMGLLSAWSASMSFT
jgi:hypothetical protein